jgi:hypothetical protein
VCATALSWIVRGIIWTKKVYQTIKPKFQKK